jgi:hypothetical protein
MRLRRKKRGEYRPSSRECAKLSHVENLAPDSRSFTDLNTILVVVIQLQRATRMALERYGDGPKDPAWDDQLRNGNMLTHLTRLGRIIAISKIAFPEGIDLTCDNQEQLAIMSLLPLPIVPKAYTTCTWSPSHEYEEHMRQMNITRAEASVSSMKMSLGQTYTPDPCEKSYNHMKALNDKLLVWLTLVIRTGTLVQMMFNNNLLNPLFQIQHVDPPPPATFDFNNHFVSTLELVHIP